MAKRTAAKPYHHGDLRSALIQSALSLLETQGPKALTLRGVARSAGVSQAAPYRHFSDHQALVAAVAEEGFRRLGDAMMAAIQTAQGQLGFKQIAIAYVRFGHENPALYRIMFGPDIAAETDVQLHTTASSVLDFVKHGVEALQSAGLVGPGDAGVTATALWSMLHGLVMLSLDGQTQGLPVSLDELVEATTNIMMFGMAPR